MNKKQVIRINENQLRQIVTESVKRVLKDESKIFSKKQIEEARLKKIHEGYKITKRKLREHWEEKPNDDANQWNEELKMFMDRLRHGDYDVIDENIDEELMSLAASHGINLKGFKHVIETSGIQHAEKRHGIKSNDRAPLSLEDYLLIPFIIKNRDKVEVSAQTDISHHNTVLKYTKQIGDTYYHVEEIRMAPAAMSCRCRAVRWRASMAPPPSSPPSHAPAHT